MTRRPLPFALGVVLVLLGGVAAAEQPGPTVYTTPDDPTPYRRSDDTSLFRERRVPDLEPSRLLERRLGHELDLLGSRTVARPDRPIPELRLQQRLGASEERLRTLKTRRPNDSSVPILERRLDRLQRPTSLGR